MNRVMPAPDNTVALKQALIAAVMWWEGVEVIRDADIHNRGITFAPGYKPSWLKGAVLALAHGETK